jgi:hypothetical protein
MKTRTYVSIMIFVLALLIIAGSCAPKKRIIIDLVEVIPEELYGTWINEEYKGSTPPFGKDVYNPDGTFEWYRTEPSPWETDVEILEGGWIRGTYGTYTIEDKWTDSDGNVWYKVEVVEVITSFYMLMKISDSNRVLEYMVGRVDYLTEIDPNDVQYRYRIYYRQE